MTVPTLTWRDCPSGRKIAMLGEHHVGYYMRETVSRWPYSAAFTFNRHTFTIHWEPCGTEELARAHIQRAFADWWQMAGLA